MKKLTLSVLALSLTLGANAAFANEKEWKDKFESADVNDDEMLSLSEWTAQGQEMFNEIDADDDGQVSMLESKEFKKEHYKDKKDSERNMENTDKEAM